MSVINASWVNIITGAIATSAAPTTATQGIEVPVLRRGKPVVIRLRHTTTAGNDARTCTIKLYGYCPGEVVQPTGVAVGAAAAGWDDINESYSLASVSADGNVTAFVLESVTVYSRLYCRVTAISGTGTALGVAAAFTEE